MERSNRLISEVIASNKARGRKKIDQWRAALQAAESVERPNRALLYNLYDELVLDADWIKESNNRALGLKACKFTVKDANGELDTEKVKLFKKPWFYHLMELYMETKHWGHSLVEIGDLDENGEISGLTLINRWHIRPESGLFVKKQSDQKGIFYREDEKYYNYLFEIGEPKNLGLLNPAAPHILYKRFAQSAWSEYCEIFGMPVRVGKTNTKDSGSLRRMEQMLENMATAAYGVVDDNEEITFIESNGGKGEVYENLMKVCTASIAKLINGAVIGEDSKGGSRSKEEVGERTGLKITEADKEGFESFVNFNVIPKMIKLGYDLEGCEYEFEINKNINELWKIANGLLTHYDISEEYIQDTFNIPVTKKIEPKGGLSGGGLF